MAVNQTGLQLNGWSALMTEVYPDSGKQVIMGVLMKCPMCLDTFKKFFIYISNKSFCKNAGHSGHLRHSFA